MNYRLKMSAALWLLFLSLNLTAQYDPAVQAYILYTTNVTDMSVHSEATKLKGDTILFAFELSDSQSIASADTSQWYPYNDLIQIDTIPNSPELWDPNGSAAFSTEINSGQNRLIQLAMGVYAPAFPGYNFPMSNIIVIQVAPRAIYKIIIK